VIALGLGALALCALAAVSLMRARARSAFAARLLEGRQAAIHRGLSACIGAARHSPEAVLRRFSQAIRALDPAVDAVLCFERAGSFLRCTFADGSGAEFVRDASLPIDANGPAPVSALLLGHRIASRGLARPLLPTDRAFLAVPLFDGARTFGSCYCVSQRVDALAGESAIVALAELTGPTLALARERARDREHASIDALTGLLTARTFRDRLADAKLRERGRYALAFVDTDNFKACNDTLGHAAGDAVLRELAAVLTRSAGADAVVARNGGDEFCILFEGLAKAEAIRRAEAVRTAVRCHAFEPILGGRAPALPISASIGIASFPDDADCAGALLERADAAMYHSKRAGRDRVSFYALDGTLCEVR
jgi:diguanylate cyclase (GGDEF)-like protein